MCDCPSILMSLVFWQDTSLVLWQDTLLQRLQDLPDVSSMKFACELLDAIGHWRQHGLDCFSFYLSIAADLHR